MKIRSFNPNYKCSFFPQTIRDWNYLPDSLFSTAEMSDDCVSKPRFTRAFKGLISPPSEPPGEIMSFGVSPVNYSDSDSDSRSDGIYRRSTKVVVPFNVFSSLQEKLSCRSCSTYLNVFGVIWK